jgi:hypothetical protein
MKRLVQVAHEVQQEFQRDDPLLGVCCRTGEFRRELLDLVDDTIARRPVRCRGGGRNRGVVETRLIEVRAVKLYIDEMPLARAVVSGLRGIPVGVPVLVSPGGLGRDIVCR